MYKWLPDGSVIHVESGRSIPSDPENPDWREFERWRAAGHEPLPAE